MEEAWEPRLRHAVSHPARHIPSWLRLLGERLIALTLCIRKGEKSLNPHVASSIQLSDTRAGQNSFTVTVIPSELAELRGVQASSTHAAGHSAKPLRLGLRLKTARWQCASRPQPLHPWPGFEPASGCARSLLFGPAPLAGPFAPRSVCAEYRWL